jgi:hypothetical protein
VLVVQSAHDPATPLEGARRTVAALRGARMLLVTGEGDHGLYAGGNACVDAAVERWITAGRLPAAGATCRGRGYPDPEAEGLPPRPAGVAGRAAGKPPAGVRPARAVPVNPLAGLGRIRTAVGDRLRASLMTPEARPGCRSGAAGGC